jgi:hypothetical protein
MIPRRVGPVNRIERVAGSASDAAGPDAMQPFFFECVLYLSEQVR